MIVGAPVLALGWWLGTPLLFDTKVSEEFPMSAGAVVPDDMTQEDVGNIGDQNHDIPSGIDIADYRSLVTYCQPFHVIFSVAALG